MTSPRIALLWSFAERYINLVIGLVSAMIIARVLTPKDIGLFSVCAAALAITATLRDFGVSEYLIQEKELTKEKIRGAFLVAIATAWPLGLLVFACRGLIASYFGEPGLAPLLAILSINFAILPLATPAFALMNREMQFRTAFVIQVSANATQSVASVGLALAGFGAYSLAWASVVNVAAQAIAVTVARPRNSFVLPGIRGAAGVLRYGTLSVTGRVIDTATGNAHEFIIAKLFGFSEVGLFSRALGLVEMFSKNVTSAIARVAMPVLAKAHRSDERLVYSFARGTAIFTGVAWPFFTFLAVAAPELILVLFGAQWGAAATPATLLAVSMIPSSLYALSASTLSAMGLVERRLRISIQFSPLHVAGLFLTALLGGFQALALTWIATHCILLVLHTRQLKGALQASWLELYQPSGASIVLTIICGAVVALAMWSGRHFGLPPILRLVVVSGLGAVAWFFAVRLVEHPVRAELNRAFGAIRKLRAPKQTNT